MNLSYEQHRISINFICISGDLLSLFSSLCNNIYACTISSLYDYYVLSYDEKKCIFSITDVSLKSVAIFSVLFGKLLKNNKKVWKSHKLHRIFCINNFYDD